MVGIQTKDFKNCVVFRWYDINKRHWLIVARNQKEAVEWAFAKVKKRATRFKGLARLAISKLLVKSGSRTGVQAGTQEATNTAEQNTKVVKTKMGNRFSIEATDLLDYAMIALKGG